MSGFDRSEVYFTGSFHDDLSISNVQTTHAEFLKRFKKFIREYQTLDFEYIYRDQLKRNFNLGNNYLIVNLEHVANFDSEVCNKLMNRPNEYLTIFESAAESLIRELALVSDDAPVSTLIQIMLTSKSTIVSLRDLKSDMVSKIVKIAGVVVSASSIRSKATKITLQCRSCQTTIPNINLPPGLDGYALPRQCPSSQPGSMGAMNRAQCPLDPFFVVPDKCKCVDFQQLKLQELPELTPAGEIPRHVSLYCDRYLVERVTPGTRVVVTGIYSIKKIGAKSKDGDAKMEAGIRKPYIRVLGIESDSQSHSSATHLTEFDQRSKNMVFSSAEEVEFRKFAARPDAYEILAKNIAPSIYGSEDIKKSIACLLFGGSRKRLPDGLIRRGDINVLLLGDPGTAKSQLLKFVEKVAPVCYYTSGKGSSAAGLTASLTRDASSRGFVIEGGAMVLADGGVVCIDEFDKMREDDRVAIHEAMEQQTISIAKAGITTKLNSRCSVLAAANSVYGRWDDTKGQDNIEFMPTILSRFDMIYIVKDEHNATRDMKLASHVLQVHIDSNIDRRKSKTNSEKGELSNEFLTRYISFCKQNCAPRLTHESAEKLKHYYVKIRNRGLEMEKLSSKKMSINITVRQLEAIIRISEALAKMRLLNFATDEHINEALRLFTTSTLDAASSGSLSGAEGFVAHGDIDEIRKIEKQIKQRFAIGTQVSEQRIVQDLLKQKFGENSIHSVINIMLRRGELQHRFQRKLLFRYR